MISLSTSNAETLVVSISKKIQVPLDYQKKKVNTFLKADILQIHSLIIVQYY